MEVQFQYTRDDWLAISVHTYKSWLHSLKPLHGGEYRVCWFFFVFSLLGSVGLLVFLGFALCTLSPWYYVVGAVVLLCFLAGLALEVLRPKRDLVRGLIHELMFRLDLQDKMLDKIRNRNDRQMREQLAKGALNLEHRYTLRIDSRGYTLVTEFPAAFGPGTRKEMRREWGAVTAVDLSDSLLIFEVGGQGFDFVPRRAFAEEATFHQLARTVVAYRKEYVAEQERASTQFRARQPNERQSSHSLKAMEI
jgi:hypothetical protein